MKNMDLEAAIKYHQATKHSLYSVQANRHYLDWDNQPAPYKEYRDVERVPLPENLPQTGRPALQSLVAGGATGQAQPVSRLDQIAYLLYYSAGITKRLVYPGGEIAFRAAACAGALYPIEVYLVCRDLAGLPAGVYHFGPAPFELRRLRQGDFREALVQDSGEGPDVAGAPVILVFTAITWRSSWKYQARAYRYHFWDCGMILANCLAACAAQDFPARVVMGFVDGEVNRLLGIDGAWEKSLALLPVGQGEPAPPAAPPVAPLDLEVLPLSDDWREYPLIDQMHATSILEDPAEVRRWREQGGDIQTGLAGTTREPAKAAERFKLEDLLGGELPEKTLEEVIIRRGSSRSFHQEPIAFSELSTMLSAAFAGFDRDWTAGRTAYLNELFLSVHAVDGLPAGAYRFLEQEGNLELLKTGNFRSASAHLCLGQDLGGTASATGFFLTGLEAILERYGNRGYRAVQMEAGILGGRLYLAAYALGHGASGLTFFDDDVIQFFSPAASGMEPVFVTALGVPAPPGRRTGRLVYTPPGESGE